MNRPTLETNRLVLREFTENDLQAIYEIFGDETVNRFLPWFPLKSLAEAKAFFEKRLGSKQGQYHYAVCFKEEKLPIGYVDVSAEDSHDLGYGLRKEFWHQGIITEACKAVIEQLKKDGVPYITATHDIHNPRSGEVMKRLQMQYQYSYEERWQPKDRLVIFRMYQRNLDGQKDRVYKKYWDNTSVHFIEKVP